MPYKRVREQGIVFYFKYDDQHPEMLHIFVRHLTDVDDALDVFFDPNRRDSWNKQRQRWETESATHALYWTWLEENEKVLVISCFTL
ncbi:MAG: hypothetical protein ACYC1C_20075 [Chloroflexota bacterium]